ncbi:WD40 repeat-like protein [Cristinia sonorae]|uniref:WD40 repeat-like protein n=1 Tax=Cristinia sonorae TaxID=1940300 RepID=A0A8K0XQ04_9AGAR|nr:WD40 repeat-like protein [Cristinia sonorae]
MTEPKPISVHRCRFVDFTPSPITALAFPPLSLPSVKGKKSAAIRKRLAFGTLAVGHANGNIELCEWTGLEHEQQAPQAWVVKKTLSGLYTSKVDSLAFTIRDPDLVPSDQTPALSSLRLFSAGGGNDLAEWDIERGVIRRTISSQGGSIWSIAPNPASTILALGCEDGSIHLLSLELDSLTHLRRFDRVKSRILSLAWGPPVPRESQPKAAETNEDSDDDDDDLAEDWSDSWLVAGCSDSCLRKWDVASGRVLDRMATDKNKGERTLVWTVGALGDGTIISGDSLGVVKFWDPKTCTQMHSFQAHNADVLCMTISPEGSAIYTAGVDQKIVQFTHVRTSQPASSQAPTKTSLLNRSSTSRWVQSFARRMHSHDIRSICIFPPHTPLPPSHSRTFPADVAPILASGGLDMSVVLTPAALPTNTKNKIVNPLSTSHVATWEDAYHRKIGYSSGAYGRSGVCVARAGRLVCCVREAGVSVWRIKKRGGGGDGEEGMDVDEVPVPKEDGGWERVLDMELNVQSNLIAGAISDDGRWLIVSDWYETKLFRLESLPNGQLKPKRIRNLTSVLQPHVSPSAKSHSRESISTGGSTFAFTPDSSKLVLATSVSAYILVIDLSGDAPRVLRKFDHHHLNTGLVGQRVVKGLAKLQATGTGEDATEKSAETVGVDKEDEDTESTSGDVRPVSTTVTRMATSLDGQWLATSDDLHRTHIFNLDSIQHHCILPSFPHPIHALAFLPSSPSTLILGLANNTVQVYDVEARSFPAWSRHLANAIPKRFKHLHDPIVGVTFNTNGTSSSSSSPSTDEARTAVFWGSTWICKIQLDAGVVYGGFEKKRRRDGSGKKRKDVAAPPPEGEDTEQQPLYQSANNFKLITTYRPILFAEFIASGELVVVERPLVDVLAKLPPAYFKPKYGAS